jgi:hypothetical protein
VVEEERAARCEGPRVSGQEFSKSSAGWVVMLMLFQCQQPHQRREIINKEDDVGALGTYWEVKGKGEGLRESGSH